MQKIDKKDFYSRYSAGQDVDLRLDRPIDPRLARLDQDLRGSLQTQPTSVTASPVISVTTDPRGPSTFNVAADK